MSESLLQKRSASEAADPPTKDQCKKYNVLLSILSKSLIQSRERIASDAPQTIKESYGDMTSLFTSSEDSDGVSSLVDLLLGKLDSVHDRFNSEKLSSTSKTRLEKILKEQNIYHLLSRIESAIEEVEQEERAFTEADTADRESAREAIKLAKSTRLSPTTGKKRRVLPAESIGYHAHKMKLEYQASLTKELEEVERENEELEAELKNKWGEWQSGVEGIKSALGALNDMGNGKEGNK